MPAFPQCFRTPSTLLSWGPPQAATDLFYHQCFAGIGCALWVDDKQSPFRSLLPVIPRSMWQRNLLQCKRMDNKFMQKGLKNVITPVVLLRKLHCQIMPIPWKFAHFQKGLLFTSFRFWINFLRKALELSKVSTLAHGKHSLMFQLKQCFLLQLILNRKQKCKVFRP